MSDNPPEILDQIQKMVSADDEEMAKYHVYAAIMDVAYPDIERAQLEHLLYAAVSSGLRGQDAMQAVTVGVLGIHKGRAETRRVVMDAVNGKAYDTLRFDD